MLSFSDQPYQYFPPKRNALAAWLLGQYNRLRYLPRVRRVLGVTVSGELEALSARRRNSRLLLVPNHPTHADAYVYLEALRQTGVASHIMAAYDVFLRRRLNAWIMQRFGVFSVDREGSDRQAMQQAMQTLVNGPTALTIFAEGNVYLQNDVVTPFHEGAAFIALRSAKALAKQQQRVVLTPVSIKLTYAQDVRTTLQSRLEQLAQAVEAPIEAGATPLQQVRRIGRAGLTRHLKHRGIEAPTIDSLSEFIRQATESVVAPLERKMDAVVKPDDTIIERIRKLRRIIHDIRIDPQRRHDHAAAAQWADQAMLALRIASYSGDYMQSRPTVDRVAETIEKLTEDFHDQTFPPLGDRWAFVHFGRPVDCGERLKSFTQQSRTAVRELTVHCEQSVQDGIDQLNLNNPHPGGRLWDDDPGLACAADD